MLHIALIVVLAAVAFIIVAGGCGLIIWAVFETAPTIDDDWEDWRS